MATPAREGTRVAGLFGALAGASLPRRIAWATGARLVALVVLLFFMGVLQLRGGYSSDSFTIRASLGTLVIAFSLSAVYALQLRSGRMSKGLVPFQLVADQGIWTAVVFLSGGPTSGATSFYGLSVLLGAVLAGFRGAAIAGGAGCLFFFFILAGLGTGLLPPPSDQPPQLYLLRPAELLYSGFVNGLVMVVVALLAGNLVERLRAAGGQLEEARERADQAERLAALGRLAAGLAHEIRNPLGSISGSIQLLRENRSLADEEKQLCDIIRREAVRLNDLVTDMLDLSRRRKPELTLVEVVQTAGDVVALAATSGRGVSDVTVVLEGVKKAYVFADRAQVQQMTWNLVRNAVQASSAGDVVRVVISVDHAGEVELAVIDTGVGLGSAQDNIFNAFFTTRSSGTGIGLAVVKQIADEHGFRVSAENGPHKGAIFRVNMGEGVQDADQLEAEEALEVPAVVSRRDPSPLS